MKTHLIIGLLLIAATAWADRNVRSLANLAETSTVVVAGTVTNVRDTVTDGYRWSTAQILVQEVLKGPITNRVQVCWPRNPNMDKEDTVDFAPRVVGQPLVWFLWRTSDTGFQLGFTEEVQQTNVIDTVRQIMRDHNKPALFMKHTGGWTDVMMAQFSLEKDGTFHWQSQNQKMSGRIPQKDANRLIRDVSSAGAGPSAKDAGFVEFQWVDDNGQERSHVYSYPQEDPCQRLLKQIEGLVEKYGPPLAGQSAGSGSTNRADAVVGTFQQPISNRNKDDLKLDVRLDCANNAKGGESSFGLSLTNSGQAEVTVVYYYPLCPPAKIRSAGSDESLVDVATPITDGFPFRREVLRIPKGVACSVGGMDFHLREIRRDDEPGSGGYVALKPGLYEISFRLSFAEDGEATWSGSLQSPWIKFRVTEQGQMAPQQQSGGDADGLEEQARAAAQLFLDARGDNKRITGLKRIEGAQRPTFTVFLAMQDGIIPMPLYASLFDGEWRIRWVIR